MISGQRSVKSWNWGLVRYKTETGLLPDGFADFVGFSIHYVIDLGFDVKLG